MKREERDLGMFMSKDLKFSLQSRLVKNKANLMLGIMNRGVSNKSAEVISKLYGSYVKLHRVLYPVLDTNNCKRCIYTRGSTEKSN